MSKNKNKPQPANAGTGPKTDGNAPTETETKAQLEKDAKLDPNQVQNPNEKSVADAKLRGESVNVPTGETGGTERAEPNPGAGETDPEPATDGSEDEQDSDTEDDARDDGAAEKDEDPIELLKEVHSYNLPVRGRLSLDSPNVAASWEKLQERIANVIKGK